MADNSNGSHGGVIKCELQSNKNGGRTYVGAASGVK